MVRVLRFLLWITEWAIVPLHRVPLPAWPSWYDSEMERHTNPGDYYGDLGCACLALILQPMLNAEFRLMKGRQ